MAGALTVQTPCLQTANLPDFGCQRLQAVQQLLRSRLDRRRITTATLVPAAALAAAIFAALAAPAGLPCRCRCCLPGCTSLCR